MGGFCDLQQEAVQDQQNSRKKGKFWDLQQEAVQDHQNSTKTRKVHTEFIDIKV